MRNLPHPSFQYSGLTIILDKPSRFDSKQLCSGRAGEYFEECLLAGGQPNIHRASVEIRTLASIAEPLLPGTKTLLLLGPDTVGRYLAGVSLDEQRGSPFKFGDYTCIASYSPQDSYDRRDYFGADEEDDESKDTDASAEKTTHGRTQRKNWRFWMRQDIRKAIRLTVEGLNVPTCNYHYWPDIEEVLKLLTTTKGVNFYFDIETDKHLQMTCFGFSLDEGKNVYVVPMLQTQLNPQIYFYHDTHKILRALAICLRDNTVVVHNSMFDLFVLAYRYGIPLVGKVYDTMLAHNRCYIEVEKSLGHVISLHTDLPYHKNEGIFEPHTQAQTQQLYEYNGKDVFALTQIKTGIDKTAVRIKATESIEQVNRAVLPYLTATLQGMKLDEKKIAYFTDYYRRYNEQVRRILHFITGGQDFNPNSWQQVSRYLYGDGETTKGLGIPKPAKDPTNEKTLLELLLKHDVPAIHAILRFRGNQKRISKAGLKTKKGEPRYWWGARFDKPSAAPRLTTAWILSGTTTMRLGSRKLLRRWGDNCLLPSSEVLTKTGWKRLDAVLPTDEIMQWSQTDHKMSWCKAVVISKHHAGVMIRSDSFYHKHSYTPEHRVPVYDLDYGTFEVKTAETAIAKYGWKLPTSGHYSCGTVSFPQIRILAMMQADGSFEDRGMRFEFKKARKIERFLQLMREFNIPFTEQSAHDGCRRFYVAPKDGLVYFNLLGQDKQYGDWLLNYDHETLSALVDEVGYWDATRRGRSYIYLTKWANNASWISTVAHLVGMLASSREQYNGNSNTLWYVNIKPADRILCNPAHFYREDYEGMVFCLQTETGFFLTRHNNHIVVTGNCQNWEKLLRKEVIPDEGKCFIQPDQSGAEALIVAYLCRPGQFRDIFLTGVNPHVYLAMHLFQQQFEAELGFKLTDFVQASVKEVASISRWAEVTKCIKASDDWEPSRRYYFIAKQGNHSLNYDAKARAFRLNTLLKSEGAVAMDLATAQAVIDTRLKLFPEIPSWQQEIVAELWRTKLLRNLFGHPRLFTGHIQESMYKEAYAFKAQSTVGQITNYAFTELQERLVAGDEVLEKAGFDVLQNNHDSVLGQCWIDSKEIVGREMQKHMQRKLVSPRGEVFYMKSDVSWSPTSWGEMEPLKLN